jgi:hypothetical protein
MSKAKRPHSHDIHVQVDRVQLVSWAPQGRTPPRVKGFKVTQDCFVRMQTSIPTYERCRFYLSKENDAKIYWQYQRRTPFLKPWKITVVADDKTGLSYEEIDTVLRHCKYWHFLIIEVAFDFSPSTGVDRNFVRRHAIFGKSRRRQKRGTSDDLYFGSRKSDKFVRCYEKEGVDSYRVEPELHPRLLRREQIRTLDDFDGLAVTICPKHFQFVDVDWGRLERHLMQKRHNQVLIAGARKRVNSLARLRRFLRRHGITNFHRFLKSHPLNKKIDRAITSFIRDFQEVA